MTAALDQLEARLAEAMQADRHRLRGLVRRIRDAERAGQPFDRWLEQLTRQTAQSCDERERRQRNRPRTDYDPQLPITARRDEIAAAIAAHPVVVVCGETGSGKSTQLPKICLDVGRGVSGMIGHTQPRRIAARSVAARLAQELNSSVGRAVGYKVRFTDATSNDTYVKLMTDGILLAETQFDRFLDHYDTLIIDEAHERSLNIDFLLGYLKRVLPKRPDLRVVITSATIDAERFAEHFASEAGPAPVLHVSGRTYPVDVWYRPPHEADDDDEPDRHQAVLDAIDELMLHDHRGDILVFLSTEREILEVAKSLRGRGLDQRGGCEILPLYARLSVQEQNRVFEPHSRRRIVLATNVAESSLTVPGIRYVVDTGLARISRYSPRSKIQRLPIEPVSQASADQRKGRCGRVEPGICVRLYAEDDYLGRERYTAPEIRRSNLAAVILQAESLRLGAIEEFPFLDPPQPQLVRDGYSTLFELGAVDDHGQLTPLGKQLSHLPVDPRIARIITAGIDEGCLRDVLIIAAALEVQDPRERPIDKQQAADEAHAKFVDPDSDFLTYLNLWHFHQDLKDKLSKNQLRRACHQNFLSPTRMREWHDVHLQLLQLVHEHLGPDEGRHSRGPAAGAVARQSGSSQASPPVTAQGAPMTKAERDQWYGRVHRALLTGLLSNVALKKDAAEYTGAGNMKLQLWPGSSVYGKKPLWIVAAELVETTRRFARTVARIQPEWLLPLAEHLVQREYSEPHWSEKHCAAMAYEKTTLFGLTINSRKLVPYGSIDPEWSREQFIREGLVKCEIRASAPFLDHNRRLRADAEKLLAKTRRTDLVVDDFAIYGFYSQRLPADIYDAPRLNRWRKEAEQQNPRVLFMELTDMTAAVAPPKLEEYPDQCQLDRVKLPLEYRFEPGAEDDGVTIVVPQAALGQVTAERLGWLVPGLLEQKVTAIIRALPKAQRRNLVPVPDTAAKVVAKLRFGEGRFLDCVSKLLTELAGEPITPLMLDQLELPPHLKMNVRVIDDQGQAVRTGRDVDRLRKDLQDEMRAALKAAALAGGLLAGARQGGGLQGGATPTGGLQGGRGGGKPGSDRASGGGVASTTSATGGLTIGRPAQGKGGAAGPAAAVGAGKNASGPPQVAAGATGKPGAKSGAATGGGRAVTRDVIEAMLEPIEPEVQHPWHRDKLVQWNFGDLPEKFELRRGGVLLTLFPALVDQGAAGAGLRLADSREQADDWTRAGTRRLFAIAEHRDLKMQVEWFPDLKQLTLCAAGLYSAAELRSDIEALIADRAFVGELPLVRSADEFQWRLKKGRASIELAVQDAVKVVGPVLKSYHGVRLLLDTAKKIAPYAVDDVNSQSADLLVKNFLTVVPWRWLQHFPRYVEAQRQRLLKATQGGLTRDRQMHAQLTPLVARYRQRRQENEQRGRFDPELEAYRWLLEELRVSMFAQQLGTSTPVSIKRLDQQWQKVS